jgi:hypothetical protein
MAWKKNKNYENFFGFGNGKKIIYKLFPLQTSIMAINIMHPLPTFAIPL